MEIISVTAKLEKLCFEVEYSNDDGEVGTVDLPGEFKVCSECDGKGSIVHPSISLVTPDEFAEDPDFEESYFSGVYDITCPECKGLRVVLVMSDVFNGDPLFEVWQAWVDWGLEKYYYEKECAAERRMGA